jgi:hypothetical protein
MCTILHYIDSVMSVSSRTSSVSAISETTLPVVEQADPDRSATNSTSSKNAAFSTDVVKGKHEECIVKYNLCCLYFQHIKGKCMKQNFMVGYILKWFIIHCHCH